MSVAILAPFDALGSTKGCNTTCSGVPRAVPPPKRRRLRTEIVLKCDNLQEGLRPEALDYAGLLTVGPQSWPCIQTCVDHLWDSKAVGQYFSLQSHIPFEGASSSDNELDFMFHGSAANMLAALAEFDLPQGLVDNIRSIAAEIGVAVAKLFPSAKKVIMKLELMVEKGCFKWHQDHYICRAIVSYNCCGTEYIHDDHVDFWELKICDNNDCVVKDRTAVCQVGAGDILFIKDKLYPAQVNGLVRRSPDPVFHPNGRIQTRLILKVDVAA